MNENSPCVSDGDTSEEMVHGNFRFCNDDYAVVVDYLIELNSSSPGYIIERIVNRKELTDEFLKHPYVSEKSPHEIVFIIREAVRLEMPCEPLSKLIKIAVLIFDKYYLGLDSSNRDFLLRVEEEFYFNPITNPLSRVAIATLAKLIRRRWKARP